MNFHLIYAERYIGDTTEKAVFTSPFEFVCARHEGWTSSTEKNAKADRVIALSDEVLRYLAPMACGEWEGAELTWRYRKTAEGAAKLPDEAETDAENSDDEEEAA